MGINISNPTAIIQTVPPIGSITAWLKSFAGTPGLPWGWVECDGQVLSDAESPYNGATIPNLNGSNLFLQGNATSGGTGGGSHEHVWVSVGASGDGGTLATATGSLSAGSQTFLRTGANVPPYGFTYNTSAASSIPPYMQVVWVMRVK